MNKTLVLLLVTTLLPGFVVQAQKAQCDPSVVLQVLGSGGPEINDGRASSSYLIWYKSKAKVVLDVGSGSSVWFDKANANFAHLDAIFLSHLHTDHSADLPAFIKGSYFTLRVRDLRLYGPSGNNLMPATTEFVQRLFGEHGAYAYLSDYLYKGRESYQLLTFDIKTAAHQSETQKFDWGSARALSVHHGPNPALAWRIDIGGCTVAYSGDMSNKTGDLAAFVKDVDLLIAHIAIPDSAGTIAKNLHMPPSEIGQILKVAKPKRVLLSHIMRRSEANLDKHLLRLEQRYDGEIILAKELLKQPVQPAR